MKRYVAAACVFGAMALPAVAVADATTDLWKAKCANCHGEDGKGQTKMGKKMKVADMTSAETQKKLKDEEMRKAILEGINRTEDGTKQKMEAYKDLKAEQVDALIAMIRSWAAKEPAPTP